MYDIENPYHKRASETGYPYSWQDEGESEEFCLEDYFTKFNRYTTEGAIEYYRRGKKCNIFQLAFNPVFKFLRMYLFRLGFLDGKEGFLLACTSSLYTMVKYYKLYEITKNKSYMEK